MAKGSVIEITYLGIKREITNRSLLPGEKVDIDDLCERYGTSASPIRNALNRLVGEGLLITKSHDGFYAPRVTEQSLRQLYQFNEELLLTAVQKAPNNSGRRVAVPAQEDRKGGLIQRTENLFIDIMSARGNAEALEALRRTNDRLRPIRLITDDAPSDLSEEIDSLEFSWETRDLAVLEGLIGDYHKKRIATLGLTVGMAYTIPPSAFGRHSRRVQE